MDPYILLGFGVGLAVTIGIWIIKRQSDKKTVYKDSYYYPENANNNVYQRDQFISAIPNWNSLSNDEQDKLLMQNNFAPIHGSNTAKSI